MNPTSRARARRAPGCFLAAALLLGAAGPVRAGTPAGAPGPAWGSCSAVPDPAYSSGAGTETGDIKGRIKDDTGIALPGVEITAAGPALQGVRAAVSSRTGDYHLPLLPVGNYTLTFKLAGFAGVKQESVAVRLGMTTTLDATLSPAAIAKEITVTAEAPLIDRTSTDTSYRLSAADLEKLPAQNRTTVDVVKLAPGVTGVRADTRHGTATEGQPSIRGEGEEGNTWIVDGLATSGVRMKNSGVKLNFDAIDEIQIISDPFSPEFGSAYGGIVNLVTKSGGNDFHGTASFVFMNKALQAARQPQLSLTSEPAAFSDGNAYVNLGGPLLRDKLWFFLSENYYANREETKEGALGYLPVPGGTRTTGNNNLFAKLTFAPAGGHTLSLTAIADRSFTPTGRIGLPELNEIPSYSDLAVRLNYKGILSGTMFLEAGLGYVGRDSSRRPASGSLDAAQYYINDLAQNIRAPYGNVTDNESRWDASARLTAEVETEKAGRHELAVGLEYYRVSSDFTTAFTGRTEDVFPGDGYDNGTKYTFDTWNGGAGTPVMMREYGTFAFVNSSSGIGFFAKDKATIGRFTIMAGLRAQTQVVRDSGGRAIWSWGLMDFLSPRFTLAVDLTGDGVNVLKVGWGRFADPITTMPLGFFNAGGSLTYRDYAWTGPARPTTAELRDPAHWTFQWEQAMQRFEVMPGVQPNFQSRILVEFDRRLGRDWVVKARYVHTSAANLLEALMILDLTVPAGYKFVYDNFDLKRRSYDGLEIEITGRIGRRLFVNASYSHASAKGTNPGQTETGSWSQEEGGTNYVSLFGKHMAIPDLPELAATKAEVDRLFGGLGGQGIGEEGWYGRLPYSVDHDVKLNASYLAPAGFTLAAAFEYISGYPWEKMGYVPGFGGYYAFPEGRGTRTTPPHAYLDLGVEKSFVLASSGLLRNASLAVRLDVFNVFDSQEPISYVKENVPIFGQVWGRQQPRQARVSANLRF